MVLIQAAHAGAGWGDTTNVAPDPAISASAGIDPATGLPIMKVRTYYANSPQGIQVDAITGAARDTGTALRKFVDALPGLAAPGGGGITIAQPDPNTYPGSDYYEIAVVEYAQRMHSDLAKATTLRGYVQIDPVATDANALLTNGATAPAGSLAVPLLNLDGTPVLISRPHNNDGTFVQVPAYAFDHPNYLGATIVATHDRPTRVKFYNGLPAGHGAVDPATGLWRRNGDLFIPVDHTLFGGGDGQTQLPVGRDILCGDVLSGPNNPGDPTLSACAGSLGIPNADGTLTPPGYVHVPAFAQYTENREELHLHGGDNPWISDGHPHQWIAPAADELSAVDANYRRGDIAYNVPDMPNPGPGAVTYFWPNGQSGRLMFYHDHATGLTRLNVYAGTASGYLLTDLSERALNSYAPGGEIPLVIQDKTFVPKDIATEDAKWDLNHWGQEGDLWFPHVYETNQDPLSADATNPVGRWDGASFFWPVFPQTYATPDGSYSNPSTTPEAFMDTPIVNGMAYPVLHVAPTTVRFRILGVGNDRLLNLNFLVADPAQVPVAQDPARPPALNTEVKMIPFNSPNGPTSVSYACPDGSTVGQRVGDINPNGTVKLAGWTESGPSSAPGAVTYYNNSFPCSGGLTGTGWGQADNRPGGVPDPGLALDPVTGLYAPTLTGPDIVRIGNEGGLFQAPVVIPTTVMDYEYNKRSVTVLNVLERGLWLGPAERADVMVDFSAYAGKTLILYNDSGAPVPAGDPRIDYYTGDGDQTGAGGAPNTVAGYGPNTRTIMQVIVDPAPVGAPLDASPTGQLAIDMLAAYKATQPLPVVPTPEYAPVLGAGANAPYEHIYTGSIYLNKYSALTFPAAADVFKYTPAPVCSTTATCRTALTAMRQAPGAGLVTSVIGQPVSAYVESKAIQELFETDYGRMNATLGVELPFTNVTIQTTIPLAYVDPATETIANGETQFWKITHNGVDTHPVHFHFINVQVINRMGWDGTIKSIPADEVGWKETVKMHPLEDLIVAVRAKTAPPTPFGMPHSFRQPAPNQLPSDNHGITQIDPATGNAPAAPYTNAAVDYFSEYVWHCHILGHEENDFMRPFIFKAQEVVSAAPVLNSVNTVPTGLQAAWTDPTPIPAVLTAYNPITNPAGFLGNPNNEIGFRVERANSDGTAITGAYAALSTNLHTYNPITLPVNAAANATTYIDPVVSGGVALPTPAAPVFVSWNATSVTLTLPALPSGGTSFTVYRDGALLAANQLPGPFVDSTAVLGGNYSYTIMAVAPVTTGASYYAYRVIAVTAAGDSVPSNSIITAAAAAVNSALSPAVAVLMPPAAPTGVTVTNPTVSSLQVNWPAAPATQLVTSYLVSTNGQAPIAATSPDIVGLLAANTSYSFTVAAVNATGTSAPSAPAAGMTLPAAPSALTLGAVTSTTVDLSWTAPTNATGLAYVVQVVPASGSFTGTVAYTGAAAVVSGLLPTTSYSFTVVASNVAAAAAAGVAGGGLSAPSNAVTALTLAGPPTGLTVTAITLNSVSLSWTAPAGAAGVTYQVNVTPALGTVAYTGTTAVVSGLASNASYAFTVVAINAAAVASPPSNQVNALTLPDVSGTPVVGTITASSVALTWAAPVGGAASYLVEYSTTAAFTPATSFSQPAPTTSATVTGLTESTTYYFRVVAGNSTGNGLPSVAVQATTLIGIPLAPTGLVFSNVTATTVTAGWTAPTGATSYDVTVNGGAVTNLVSPIDALTGLTGNTAYAFNILARNASGVSATALTGSQMTLPAAPGTPLVSAITPSSMVLTWAASTGGAATYSVQYSTTIAFTTFTSITQPAASATATVTGLTASTPYFLRVVAGNAAGSSLPSATVTATTLAAIPLAPTGLVFSNVTATTVTASWTAAASATSYDVSVNGGAVTNVTTLTRALTGLTGNTAYAFNILARNASGVSASALIGTQLTLPAAPGTPVVGTRTANSVALTWAAPAGGATTYSVQYSTNGFGTWVTTTAAAGTARTVTGLAGGVLYSFRVVANNATGTGLPSGAVNATTLPGIPLAPTALVFSNVTVSTVTASWTASAGATSYDVSVNGAAAVNVATPTRTLTGLTTNTTYAFSIRARNAAGLSAAALTGSVVTLPGAPGTPAVGAVTYSSVALSWAAPARGAATYTVQYGTSATFATFSSTTPAAAANATVTGLSGSTRYYFRVVANNASGSGAFSASVNVLTPLAPPAAPVLGAVTATNVTLSWPAAAGATNYTLYRNGVVVSTGLTTTRTQTGQVAGNAYSFTLTVTTAAGTTPQSAATVATTLPPRPAAPTVSAAGNTAANHRLTVTVPARPATATATITYTIRYQRRATAAAAWGAVTVIQTGVAATAAAQPLPLTMPSAGQYRFSLVAVDAGGSSAASPNSATATSL